MTARFAVILWCVLAPDTASAQMTTWDGVHDVSRIEVTLVYYVPTDRTPIADWRERMDYYATRLEQFHRREFGDQSVLTAAVWPEPFASQYDTAGVRKGDADATFFRTLREVAGKLDFGRDRSKGFPILLVMSDINHRPLDDFYRVRPVEGGWAFEGTVVGKTHFPGAPAGGSRATFLSHLGQGWGLVSADGWRVPYRGSDCVAWHEGVGHSIGLPHPEPADDSVMSQGQYRGWINEGFVTASQKERLGYEPPENPTVPADLRLFDAFTAVPRPAVPKPGEEVFIDLTWPEGVAVSDLRVEVMTSLRGPRRAVAVPAGSPASVSLGVFGRPTPVSYRVRADSVGGPVELWGYLQVLDEGRRLTPPPEGEVDPSDAAVHAE